MYAADLQPNEGLEILVFSNERRIKTLEAEVAHLKDRVSVNFGVFKAKFEWSENIILRLMDRVDELELKKL